MPTREINLDGTPTNVMEVTYDGCPVIAEIAKRDEDGNKLKETYVKKAELAEAVANLPTSSLDTEGVQEIVNTSLEANLETMLTSLGYTKLPQLQNPEAGKQYVLLFTNGQFTWIPLEPVEHQAVSGIAGIVAVGESGEIRLTAVADNGKAINRIVYTYDNE